MSRPPVLVTEEPKAFYDAVVSKWPPEERLSHDTLRRLIADTATEGKAKRKVKVKSGWMVVPGLRLHHMMCMCSPSALLRGASKSCGEHLHVVLSIRFACISADRSVGPLTDVSIFGRCAECTRTVHEWGLFLY